MVGSSVSSEPQVLRRGICVRGADGCSVVFQFQCAQAVRPQVQTAVVWTVSGIALIAALTVAQAVDSRAQKPHMAACGFYNRTKFRLRLVLHLGGFGY